MSGPILNTDELEYARELRAWRERRGMTKKALAEAISYDPSRVSHIESGRQAPTEAFTRQVEAVLKTGGALWGRWEAIAAGRFGLTTRPAERELRTADFIAWLADHSSASFPALYAAVATVVARLEAEPPSARHGREYARGHITRDQLAQATLTYYGEPDGGHFYRARVGAADVALSILTRPEWLAPVIELGTTDERINYVPSAATKVPRLDRGQVSAAVHRLAGVEVDGTVMVNNPLYRLLAVELAGGQLDATVTTVPFAEHALTSELIEGELMGAIASGAAALPLRDAYLPTTRAALDLHARTCVGGAVSLMAIARERETGEHDYVLFTQERSSTVLNLAGKLAVLPKGFHQPTGEPADEVRLSATLRREFEEELLGREDLEQIAGGDHRPVDLLHSQQLTEPMSWLLDRPGSLRVECTGLGFNMVTGNYEFACLLVIDDEDWWKHFGHLVAHNWEAERVHRYSSLDAAGLEALIADPRWGNESLFSLLQGLRRLGEIGQPGRVDLPPIDLAFAF